MPKPKTITRLQIGDMWVEWDYGSQKEDITIEEYVENYIKPAITAFSYQKTQDTLNPVIGCQIEWIGPKGI